MLRIVVITLTTLAISSAAHAFARVDACKLTAADGSVSWTVMTGGSCDPLEVQGTCEQDREGACSSTRETSDAEQLVT